MKRPFTFGQDYLNKCTFGGAIVNGEKFYWMTDGYTSWLVTAIDFENQSVSVKVWTSRPAEIIKAKHRA